MTTLDFNLVSIIKNAGGDPSDVTEAVWDGLHTHDKSIHIAA